MCKLWAGSRDPAHQFSPGAPENVSPAGVADSPQDEVGDAPEQQRRPEQRRDVPRGREEERLRGAEHRGAREGGRGRGGDEAGREVGVEVPTGLQGRLVDGSASEKKGFAQG